MKVYAHASQSQLSLVLEGQDVSQTVTHRCEHAESFLCCALRLLPSAVNSGPEAQQTGADGSGMEMLVGTREGNVLRFAVPATLVATAA